MSNNKYCVVPMCFNSTIDTPDKLFFSVPLNPTARRTWMTVIKRANSIGPKTNAHCCEDHFDVENDMDNYVKYKLVGGRLKLKKGIVPHKFASQKRSIEKPECSILAKHKTENLGTVTTEEKVSTSHDIEDLYLVKPVTVDDEDIDPLRELTGNYNLYCSNDEISKKHHKKIQVNIRNKVRNKGTETDDKFINLQPNEKKGIGTNKRQNEVLNTSVKEISSISTFNDCDKNGTDSEAECEKVSFKIYMQKAALLCVSREPEMLLGLSKQWYCCIQLLSQSCKCTARDVMIVLKKTRLYQSNAILALDFGITSCTVRMIVRKNIPIIASCMKTLIIFPKSTDSRVPIPFRRRYSNIKSIIHCLEIQIEKPATAVKQALTWSEHKSCNTIKYLISISPDGLINYVSEGYGGGTSDSVIFEDCGILDLLPENAAVVADRGFENISHLLQQKECTLLRPPSASAKLASTKSKVLEPTNIVALRIHAERTIGRLKNFEIIMPHATVDLKEVDLLDFVIVTASGIVNLQNF